MKTKTRKIGGAPRLARAFFALTALAGAVTAAFAETDTHVVRGHVPALVARSQVLRALDPSTELNIVITLPLRNADAMSQRLAQVYDPTSPNYRQFMTPDQFAETYGPSAADVRSLIDFAGANNMSVVGTSPNRTQVYIKASSSSVEKALNVKMQEYQHPTQNRTFFAPDREPSLKLPVPILHITGLDNIVSRASPGPQPNGAPGVNGLRSNDFRNAYAQNVTLLGKGQTVGVLQFGDDFYDSDIATFASVSNIPNIPVRRVYLDGLSNKPGSGNLELSLDIEMPMAMAPGLSGVSVYGAPFDESGIVHAINEMANPSQGEPLPRQLSTSVAINYDEDPTTKQSPIYQSFQQMALQGQTFFAASGDFGAFTSYTTGNVPCGKGDTLPFPPVDYSLVTGVGGTDLTTSSTGQWLSETGWWGSGGGPSPWFQMPSWQQTVATGANGRSTTQRSVPDVAAAASNIFIVDNNGTQETIGGTSAATPLWAGFMALVNEQAAESGRPPIGFANPALYAIGQSADYAASFHDITTGNNGHTPNPGNPNDCRRAASFSAVPGYDLVTGWGSPKGQPLIDALVNAGTGWSLLPGGGTTKLSDAVVVFNGKLYVFALGITDHHHYVASFDGKQWTGWSQVPGNGTTELADTATVFNNKLYLFGIGTGDHKHYMNAFDGTTWSGWSQVPGNGTTQLADTSAVFGTKLYVFGIGTGDHKHYMNAFDGTTWSGWSQVPGNGTTALSDAAVVFNNKLYLFGIGIADHRHYVNAFDGRAWSGWSQVPGNGTTTLSDTAAVFENKLYLFGIGIADHKHYMNAFDGNAWSGWSQAPGGGTTALPDAAVTFQDRLYLFAIGSQDHQHYLNVVKP